ncbi:hypothetical protein WMY93_000685 [Mugilogobius chulae]|uniref:RETREG1-3/ARL6IP-like N-terminal reticulon-homology domain-containing protein n=1 Tax=Mugilogobius chulae TaxID=88201 RepID=A0AAW0Q349_9GOBI
MKLPPQDPGVDFKCLNSVWEEVIHSGQDTSLQLLLKETCAFRQQNPGKFCLLMCSLCTFVALLGRYIPGVVLSYALVLGIFLWPLLPSLDLDLWLKSVLHKVDEGLGNILHKTTDGQVRRLSLPQQPHQQTHSVESDLSSITTKLDSAVCKDLCVSDTEPSDLSWTEAFSPCTDQSEELNGEDFTDHFPEFPSLEHLTNSTSDEKDLSDPAPQADQPITALTLGPGEGLELSQSDSDLEDFELLDQSELEQCEAELGLSEQIHTHKLPGFLFKLLRRH